MANARTAVQKRLDELGWSRNRLAELCYEHAGVGRATVYGWISGRRDITGENMNSILEVLGMNYEVVGKPPSMNRTPKAAS